MEKAKVIKPTPTVEAANVLRDAIEELMSVAVNRPLAPDAPEISAVRAAWVALFKTLEA